MYDTIVLKSPPIDNYTRDMLLTFCSKYESIELGTGEIKYTFTSGELEGSYDYRIRMNVDNRHWVKENTLTPQALEGYFYIRIELSLHKLMNVHNVYGGPDCIKESCLFLYSFLEEITKIKLPDIMDWEVNRIDVAKIFVFKDKSICLKILKDLESNYYSRRKLAKYGTTLMYVGSATTDKFYYKGDEFKTHDYKRLNKYINKQIDLLQGKGDNFDLEQHKLALFKINLDKVLERAMRTVRFECEIKNRKLKELFNAEIVTVKMLDDDILHEIMETSLRNIIKEDENMDIVRRSDLVKERLDSTYNARLSNVLYSVWTKIVQFGEEQTKKEMSKTTFYRVRKQLLDAGVSWSCTNVNLRQISIVPNDFTFLNDKYVDDSVSVVVQEKLLKVS